MEPALKTRLIGAAVLIALAVIFVPMFFSGEPPSGDSDSLSLDIPPAPDQDLKSRTMVVTPPGASSAESGDRVTTVELQSRKPADVHPEDSAAPVAAATATPPPQAQPEPAADTAPETAAPARGRYVVHLGAYANRANVEGLMASAKTLGLPVYTDQVTVAGKPATRVRVGPFSDRASAEAARLKIKAAEPTVPTALVALDSPPAKKDAPAKALPAGQPGGWAVQLAAFSAKADAVALRDRVRKAGFDAFVDDVATAKGTLWRVRVGPQAQRAEAGSVRDDLRSKMGLKGIIVTR